MIRYITLFSIFLISSNISFAQIYVGPGIGYSRYTPERLKARDSVSAGPRFGLVVGYNFDPTPVAAEAFYNYTSTESDEMEFNGTYYIYHAKIQTMGLLGKYMLGMAHIRFGYAFHRFNTYVTDFQTGNAVDNTGVIDEFGAGIKKTFHGPLFGAGVDIPIENIVPYAVLTSYQLNGTTSDIFEIEFGLKFKF